MSNSPIHKVNIFNSTILIEKEGKNCTMAELINYYSRPILILFRRHYPDYWVLTSEVFARMGLLDQNIDKVELTQGMVIFESVEEFQNSLFGRIDQKIYEYRKAASDFDYLRDVFISFGDDVEIKLYLTERKQPSRFETTVMKLLKTIIPQNRAASQELVVYIKQQIDSMTDKGFKDIPPRIYKEAVCKFQMLELDSY